MQPQTSLQMEPRSEYIWNFKNDLSVGEGYNFQVKLDIHSLNVFIFKCMPKLLSYESSNTVCVFSYSYKTTAKDKFATRKISVHLL